VPIRDRITWGAHNPFSDPRLVNLDQLVRALRQGRQPPHVAAGTVFRNELLDLPLKPLGYYREYDVGPTVKGKDRGKLRIVLGAADEVFITGNHYRDFRQVINMPAG
jgi:ribonuclease T1